MTGNYINIKFFKNFFLFFLDVVLWFTGGETRVVQVHHQVKPQSPRLLLGSQHSHLLQRSEVQISFVQWLFPKYLSQYHHPQLMTLFQDYQLKKVRLLCEQLSEQQSQEKMKLLCKYRSFKKGTFEQDFFDFILQIYFLNMYVMVKYIFYLN